MPRPEIVERVKKLQADLGEIQPHPAWAKSVVELREHLDAAMNDEAQYQSLGDKLRLHVIELEEEHPAVAKAMESLAAALSSVS